MQDLYRRSIELFPGNLAFRRRVDRDRRSSDQLGELPAAVPLERRKSRGTGPVYENWTFAQVDEWTSVLTGALLDMGVRKGDRIAILSDNRPEWAIAYFAIVCVGAVAVPLDRSLTPMEIENLLTHAQARFVVAPSNYTDTLRAVVEKVATVESVSCMEPCADAPRLISPQTLRKRGEASRRTYREVSIDPADPASIVYTSGTTGNPKGVVITHANLTAQIDAMMDVHPLEPADLFLSVLPMNHLYEFVGGFLGPWVFGACVVYPGSITPSRLMEAFRDCHVTRLCGVPVLFTLLYDEVAAKVAALPGWKKALFYGSMEFARTARTMLRVNPGKLLFKPIHQGFGGHLKSIICGGAALEPEVAQRIEDAGFTVAIGYGLSETSPVVSVGYVAKMPVGSVGKPIPGVEVRVEYPDAAGVGELLVRGHNVMQGYYNDPVRTAEVLRDGWFHTGDLARIDKNGFIFICGRIKDMIVTPGAKKVFPEDLEYYYGRVDQVKEICVVGLPREDGLGDEPVAYVVPQETTPRTEGSRGRTETEIRARFAEMSAKLPNFKRVRKLVFRSKGLPKTPSLKVRRFKVRELLATARELAKKTRPPGG